MLSIFLVIVLSGFAIIAAVRGYNNGRDDVKKGKRRW